MPGLTNMVLKLHNVKYNYTHLKVFHTMGYIQIFYHNDLRI